MLTAVSTRLVSAARRADWRGWVVLTWALFWGAAYLRMAVLPRATSAIAQYLSATQ